MTLIRTNITMIGSFNPSIIQPAWLRRHEVLESDAEDLQGVVQLGSAMHRFKFRADHLSWEVAGDRISVGWESKQSPEGFLRKVLSLLPHTPVRGVGNNFHFEFTRDEWDGGEPMLSGDAASINGLFPERESSTLMLSTPLDDGATLNLKVGVVPDAVHVDFNFHRTVADSDEAVDAMDKFTADWSMSVDSVRALARREVEA